jgi:hypothetical protein
MEATFDDVMVEATPNCLTFTTFSSSGTRM